MHYIGRCEDVFPHQHPPCLWASDLAHLRDKVAAKPTAGLSCRLLEPMWPSLLTAVLHDRLPAAGLLQVCVPEGVHLLDLVGRQAVHPSLLVIAAAIARAEDEVLVRRHECAVVVVGLVGAPGCLPDAALNGAGVAGEGVGVVLVRGADGQVVDHPDDDSGGPDDGVGVEVGRGIEGEVELGPREGKQGQDRAVLA